MADSLLENLDAADALAAANLFPVKQAASTRLRKATGTQLLTLVGTAYVPLAGGTMTGALTLPAGAVGTPQLMFTGAGATTGLYSTGSNDISFAVNGVRLAYLNTESFLTKEQFFVTASTGARLRLGSGTGDIGIQKQANYRLVMFEMAQVLPISLEIYTLPTNLSTNYERLTLTGVQGSSVNITAETLGTGADNLDIVLTPAGTGSVKTGPRVISVGSNAQSVGVYQLSELTTIAAAATTDTTIQMPAGAIILGVTARVTVAVTCTTSFDIGDSGSATRFGTGISKAATTTNVGSVAPYLNASALSVRITPNDTPSDNTGRVRITIYYFLLTAATS